MLAVFISRFLSLSAAFCGAGGRRTLNFILCNLMYRYFIGLPCEIIPGVLYVS